MRPDVGTQLVAQRRALSVAIERQPLVEVLVPLRLDSTANLRQHHHAKAARAKAQRTAARLSCLQPLQSLRRNGLLGGGLVVLLTRVAPRTLDSDNLASACKAARDGVADSMGLSDDSAGLTWLYAQCRGATGEYALEVAVWPA